MMKLKQLFFLAVFFLGASTEIVAEHKMNPCAYYLMIIKEFLFVYCVLPFKADTKKLEKCFVYCDRCNFAVLVFQTYGYFIGFDRVDIVAEFKKLFYAGDVQVVCNYLCHIHNQEKLKCAMCHDYYGWHVSLA